MSSRSQNHTPKENTVGNVLDTDFGHEDFDTKSKGNENKENKEVGLHKSTKFSAQHRTPLMKRKTIGVVSRLFTTP